MSEGAIQLMVADRLVDVSGTVAVEPAGLPERPGSSQSHRHWGRLRHFIGSPAGAVLGGVLFAIWTAFVNRDGGGLVSLRSSCGQFLVSTTLTLVDARLMLALFARASDRRAGAVLAAAGSLAFTYALVIGTHLLIRTPHIFMTILPGIPPTLGYTFMYTLLLLRESAETAGIH